MGYIGGGFDKCGQQIVAPIVPKMRQLKVGFEYFETSSVDESHISI